MKRSKNKTALHETPEKSHMEMHHFVNSALQEEIAKKAYELYEGRGCIPGREIEDWLEAEKLVVQIKG